MVAEGEVTCRFQPGKPLGITFEWTDGLTVSEIHNPVEIVASGDDDNGGNDEHQLNESVDGGGGVTRGDSSTPSELLPGFVVKAINGQDVTSYDFQNVVDVLKSAEGLERIVVFRKATDNCALEEVASVTTTDEVAAAVPEEDSVEEDDQDQSNQNCSPLHTSLYKAMKKSPRIKPIFVNVVNLSYWYKMRKTLGGRKHLAMIAQQNKSNLRYESFMFVIKPREEDGVLAPHKKFLLSHNSKLAAYRHSEKCIKERDSNPALNKEVGRFMNPDDILSTHFRLIVVSEVFYRLNYVDRVAIVYSELVQALGAAPKPGNVGNPPGSGFCPPSNMKLGSFFGENMCNLPMFRAITTEKPLTLIIEAYTPSQWKPQVYPPPLTERYSQTHGGLNAVEVEAAVKNKEQRKRVKVVLDNQVYDKFATTNPLAPGLKGYETDYAAAELLGLDSNVLHNTFQKRIGGAYSHFFKDLSPAIKEMVMKQFLMNKHLIQKEGTAKVKDGKKKRHDPNAPPVTAAELMKAKADAVKTTSDYDVGCDSEAEMLEEFVIRSRKFERVAIRLQRMWRIRYVHFAMRKLFWRPCAAIQIQRRVRGRFARLYVDLLKELAPVAKNRIVAAYRAWRTRERLKLFLAMVKKATEVISPLLKRFVKKLYSRWNKVHNRAARTIQCLIRAYVARAKYYRLLGVCFVPKYIEPYVIQIQAMIRGVWARRRVIIMVSDRLVQWVDVPAAIQIQSLVRGIAGRKIFLKKKIEHYHAIIIQKYLMGLHRRLIYKRLRRVMLEKYCAIQIQKMYRGRIDRELVHHRRRARWYRLVYIPSIIRTQAVVRRFIAQKFVKTLKEAHRGAITIQLAHRCYKARLIYNEKILLKRKRYIDDMAARIQKTIRRYLAKTAFKAKILAEVGKRMIAARVILKAWVNFCNQARFDILMAEQRSILYKARAKKMSDLRREIFEDVNEISIDLANAAKTTKNAESRLGDVNEFLVEAAIRTNSLRKQMGDITMDDIEKGWGEAFGLEFEQLTHQSALGKEEVRLRKIQLRKTENERVTLTAELEDTELELDNATLMEVNAYEFLRQQEIGQIEKRLRRIRNRDIRMERCKWKIPNTRVKVIRKSKGYFTGMDNEVKEGRGMQYASTVDYEKKKKRWDEEQIKLRRKQRLAYKNLTSEKYKYENYATPIQDAYNDVTSNTMSLLRGMTLDERVRRMADGFKAKEKLTKKKKGGLTFALKPENAKQDLSAFAYLDAGATGES
jgi:stress-induced morphogen